MNDQIFFINPFVHLLIFTESNQKFNKTPFASSLIKVISNFIVSFSSYWFLLFTEMKSIQIPFLLLVPMFFLLHFSSNNNLIWINKLVFIISIYEKELLSGKFKHFLLDVFLIAWISDISLFLLQSKK
jgi:hypothetical protein